ncbi:hypothetical protein [Dyadobacter frigoris]|uniref:Uncharacterized protein n=1 Tax=Dyadobacter frigoris TaxID=2576211 RepID=A0A4U6D065_9BACT|nr:hypothetical protein [Dyadobacter frigoris]TKT89497.1 hypothetical protein FDK13_24450 [Dyadobacter frigoris]
MERINKITVKPLPIERPSPILVSVSKSGGFRLTKGLYELMGSPEYVEFVFNKGELFIMQSSEETGFKITVNLKSMNFTFSCRPACKRFFNLQPQKAIVFTEPVVQDIDGLMTPLYQIKLPG